ncbi:hypothetical protein ACFQ3K_07215 [Brucella gallinifaecis]|uniref:Uncharacterized protein n=1 Tax=Brucella gallinifaecis TaxID=215590 RepID=A0A502BI36_9HYPH|nr:hypothetical protein [Brucella gallinifaecis]TPF74292.1 hypothetical protein FHY56_15185 [Brucella gallinifaecis]
MYDKVLCVFRVRTKSKSLFSRREDRATAQARFLLHELPRGGFLLSFAHQSVDISNRGKDIALSTSLQWRSRTYNKRINNRSSVLLIGDVITMQTQSDYQHSLSKGYGQCLKDRGTIASLLTAVEVAKQAANDSLRRAQSAPLPHVADNTTFIALFERHLLDRESLFSSIRQLDDARASFRP